MAAPDRRKRKKKVVVKTLVRVFFVLLLLSMLAAYISNQVTISSSHGISYTPSNRSSKVAAL